MNAKLIMTSCAITMGLIGLGLTFAPEEILILLNHELTNSVTLVFQLRGLYILPLLRSIGIPEQVPLVGFITSLLH